MNRQLEHGTVELVLGNIVDQQVDAIVNAANTGLLGGGGVDGALHRAAGPELLESCRALPVDREGRRCPTGAVRTTPAGALDARYVIHAVGPFFNESSAQKCERQLRDVHQAALAAAVEHGCESVAFPAISTGAYRFPIDRAASIAVDVACTHCQSPSCIKLIRFVLYQESQLDVFRTALRSWSPAV
ncbi:O-acetyl-ADP-ribose deacetylase [Roseiconus nitratireducens]|uniref:O-acetyl-ADP-ribose deacetylase n=1 Tax=Roseiconus nitratireducens TaxID=2605748 RepID=A0A5M6DFP4_9BACT|nr:macro domain-containing protein [Roseiconus nitratireducens]KAA5546223.1 O-acetyl-ADP-ribose deacetylase [Roseiconus nitratireducens]